MTTGLQTPVETSDRDPETSPAARLSPQNPRHDPGAPSQVLSENRHELATRFMESVAEWEKYARDIAACKGDLAPYLRREFYVLVDYLALLFQTGDATYRQLYVGEKVKQAYWELESKIEQQHEPTRRRFCNAMPRACLGSSASGFHRLTWRSLRRSLRKSTRLSPPRHARVSGRFCSSAIASSSM